MSITAERTSLGTTTDEPLTTHEGAEGFPQKVMRHILTGELDLQTIKSGAKELIRRQIARLLEKNGEIPFLLSTESSTPNEKLARELGFDVYTYLPTKRAQIVNMLTDRPAATFIGFPQDMHVVPIRLGTKLRRNAVLREYPHALATFEGPTARDCGEVLLPNNGYYDVQKGVLQPFQHTNPPGKRRGAVCFSQTGTMQVLRENEKWQIIQAGFPSISTMAGGSFYYTETDSPVDNLFSLQEQVPFMSSCLIEATVAGEKQFLYFVYMTYLTRQNVCKLLQFHMKNIGASEYTAVELEQLGAGMNFRNEENGMQEYIGFEKTHPRNDHYILVPN